MKVFRSDIYSHTFHPFATLTWSLWTVVWNSPRSSWPLHHSTTQTFHCLSTCPLEP